MGFEVIPAVDVSGGRLARIDAGAPAAVGAFGGDPAAAARAFARAGASWIHLVDVDRALTGAPRDLGILGTLAGTGGRIQASGGIVSLAEAEEALAAGAARVVLGSAALTDRAEVERVVDVLGHAVVIGVEVRAGAIRPRGSAGMEIPFRDTLGWLAGLPVPRILCTTVTRVGELEGPDLTTAGLVAELTGRPVIVAGGIRDALDLRRLVALGPGIEGGVIGRALYEGLDLRRVRQAVAEI